MQVTASLCVFRQGRSECGQLLGMKALRQSERSLLQVVWLSISRNVVFVEVVVSLERTEILSCCSDCDP
jgi:hypothetical protein